MALFSNLVIPISSTTSFEIIFAAAAGVAVLLTIITFFSTPILTTIFGDGSLEVCHKHFRQDEKIKQFILYLLYDEEEGDKNWTCKDETAEKEVSNNFEWERCAISPS